MGVECLMGSHAEYMQEWRRRRRAAGLPTDQRTPEGIKRRRAANVERHRRRRIVKPDPRSRRAPLYVRSAGEAVRRAIKTGRLVRPDHCEQCAGPGPIEAAHADYSRPLHVRWLCRSCHRRWDAAEPKAVTP